ncbi:DUF3301 domain-containing protein [Guyparkeria sp. SCN-R1]|uniref:DUF3301 domain-containing protein n=1 Tax=Guyparkeria sp. SCN-R1 TaxID=2341113 RepID=UPI000F655FCD|nr:DUF3301 domain-containing protein [Guyparkeria sp. SCN-R1]RRQ20139.1 DUF3301 domain-containing protein [Guyparkeria sp. SCN-R1]
MWTLGDVFILILVLAAVGLWVQHDRFRRRALSLARQATEKADVQLLDQSVSLRRVGLGRDDRGWPLITRRFGFEFSRSGFDRYRGHVVFRGQHLAEVELDLGDPHWRHEKN